MNKTVEAIVKTICKEEDVKKLIFLLNTAEWVSKRELFVPEVLSEECEEDYLVTNGMTNTIYDQRRQSIEKQTSRFPFGRIREDLNEVNKKKM